MKITLEPTKDFVYLFQDIDCACGAKDRCRLPMRIWRGVTSDGYAVTAHIVSIAIPRDADIDGLVKFEEPEQVTLTFEDIERTLNDHVRTRG